MDGSRSRRDARGPTHSRLIPQPHGSTIAQQHRLTLGQLGAVAVDQDWQVLHHLRLEPQHVGGVQPELCAGAARPAQAGQAGEGDARHGPRGPAPVSEAVCLQRPLRLVADRHCRSERLLAPPALKPLSAPAPLPPPAAPATHCASRVGTCQAAPTWRAAPPAPPRHSRSACSAGAGRGDVVGPKQSNQMAVC